MAAGTARVHYERTGRPVRMMRQSVREKWFDIWDGLPYLLRADEKKQPHDVLYAKDQDGLRPYIAAKMDVRWVWRAYGPSPAELRFTAEEREFAAAAAGAVILEPHIKLGASPNKDWGWARWKALIELRPDIDWLQLGPGEVRAIKGARRLVTRTFRQAAAALAASRAAVLPEGALHHAAAAVGTPAVVIFGGFIGPAVTGYPDQRNLFVQTPKWPLGCGMRQACAHCAEAMEAITPLRVARELEAALEADRRSVAA